MLFMDLGRISVPKMANEAATYRTKQPNKYPDRSSTHK